MGTMSDNFDLNTFLLWVLVWLLQHGFVQINTRNIATSANEYFTMRITSVQPHTSVRIDKFKWNKCQYYKL